MKREEEKKQKDDKGKEETTEKKDDKMEIEVEKKDEKIDKMEIDDKEKKEESKEVEKKEEKKEPSSEMLENPARVTRQQLRYISFGVDTRYSPIIKEPFGVVVLKDNKPGEQEEIISGKVPTAPGAQEDEEEEPEPPEPFEYDG